MSRSTSYQLLGSSKGGNRGEEWRADGKPVLHLKCEKNRSWNLNLSGGSFLDAIYGQACLLHGTETLHQWTSYSKTLGTKVVYAIKEKTVRDRVSQLANQQRGHTLLPLILKVMIDQKWHDFEFYRSPFAYKTFAQRCERDSQNQARKRMAVGSIDKEPEQQSCSKRIRSWEAARLVKHAKVEQVKAKEERTYLSVPSSSSSSSSSSSCASPAPSLRSPCSSTSSCGSPVMSAFEERKQESDLTFDFLKSDVPQPKVDLQPPMCVSQTLQALVKQTCLGRDALLKQLERIIAEAEHNKQLLLSQAKVEEKPVVMPDVVQEQLLFQQQMYQPLVDSPLVDTTPEDFRRDWFTQPELEKPSSSTNDLIDSEMEELSFY